MVAFCAKGNEPSGIMNVGHSCLYTDWVVVRSRCLDAALFAVTRPPIPAGSFAFVVFVVKVAHLYDMAVDSR
jgi:hypothetical protein